MAILFLLSVGDSAQARTARRAAVVSEALEGSSRDWVHMPLYWRHGVQVVEFRGSRDTGF